MSDYHDRHEIVALADRVDGWLAAIATGNPTIASIARGTSDDTMTGDPRWLVRMHGEEKDFTTVWLTLGQRTLRYETYVMPAPEENAAGLYEHLLRRNARLIGVHFAIGIEDAVFLRGELPDVALTEAELDRILGTLYATVEQCFRGLLRIGFASRLAD
jgi:putative sensory transduction regulator